MRRINPITAEADDIVRVVKRLEEAIRALHQVADLLPLLIASNQVQKPLPGGEGDEEPADQEPCPEPPATPPGPSGKEATDADPSGAPDQLD